MSCLYLQKERTVFHGGYVALPCFLSSPVQTIQTLAQDGAFCVFCKFYCHRGFCYTFVSREGLKNLSDMYNKQDRKQRGGGDMLQRAAGNLSHGRHWGLSPCTWVAHSRTEMKHFIVILFSAILPSPTRKGRVRQVLFSWLQSFASL